MEIREHEDDLWDTIKRANLQGTRFKDITRVFVLEDDLNMTRTSVAKTRGYVFSYWNIQRDFLENEEYASSNKTIIADFKEKHKSEIVAHTYGEGAPYLVLQGYSFDKLTVELLDSFMFPAGSKLNNAIIDKLDVLLKKYCKEAIVDIIWMRYGTTSDHNVENGKLNTYFVGRRPKDTTLKATYRGDYYQFVKNDRMQLQIHNIKNKNTGLVSPTLAIYIPEDYMRHLKKLAARA